MKTQFVLALLFVSINVHAQALPDPLKCGAEQSGGVVLAHTGNEFIAKLENYQTIVQFPAPGVVRVASNWGMDFDETIDAGRLRDEWQTGTLAKFAFMLDGHYSCLRPDKADGCAYSLANVLKVLSVAERRLLPENDSERSVGALRCARSMILSFMERSFASHDGLIASLDDVGVRPLTNEQVSAVSGRMQAIKKAKDAEIAATAALAIAVSSSSSSRRR